MTLPLMKILITGASSGIGAATAVHFAERGWQVTIAGRDRERLEGVYASLKGSGHELVCGDILDWAEDPKSMPQFGALNAMVWSAGCCRLAAGMLLRAPLLERTLKTNLVAPMVVTSHLYRTKQLVDGARVVWLGSQSAHDAGEGFSMYAASKGGLSAAARVLAKEFSQRKIALHCVEPATVNTPMTKALIEDFPELPKKLDHKIIEVDEVVSEVARLISSSI